MLPKCALTTHQQKEKLRKSHLQPQQKEYHLGINLIKEVKDLHPENYKTLLKEIKRRQKKLKDITCSWIGRINIVKIYILSQTIYKLSATPIKISTFFTEIEPKPLKCIQSHKRSQISNPEKKKSKAGFDFKLYYKIILPDFKLYYKNIVVKTAWYWQKNRHTDQCNRIESPERNLHTYRQLIYGKRAKNIQGERIVSSINVLGKTGQPHAKE